MQDQLICSGCRRVVQYRRGVTGVCCPGCNTLTAVNPSAAAGMSELICSGCPTLLFYNRGASNIRCPSCNRLNSTRSANQIAHLTCGQCRTTLMHPPGASTVQCATCRYVNHVRDARPQTVLVENPKTLDDKGKLVSNVVVGVTSWKR
uniref:Zinc finger LSD1-type domain-containing protein n=1 Tax=Oryza meridionalis TaxID=40149 RepID=A0A0E0EHH0_9ORYZ